MEKWPSETKQQWLENNIYKIVIQYSNYHFWHTVCVRLSVSFSLLVIIESESGGA